MAAYARVVLSACVLLIGLFLALPTEAKYIGGVRPACSPCQSCGSGSCGIPNNAPGNAPSGTATSLSEGNQMETYPGPRLGGGVGGNLGMDLHYDSYNADGSHARVLTVLGVGWTHSYNVFLFKQQMAMFRFGGDGRVTKYAPTSSTTYASTQGYFETLVRTGSASYRLRYKDGTTYTFAAVPGSPTLAGLTVYWLQTIADRNGNVTTLGYAGGLLTSVTDAYGRSLTLAYNPGRRLRTITDPLGRVTTLAYDASNARLQSVVDPAGRTTSYAYNAQYQMTGKTDRDGRIFNFGYQVDKPLSAADGGGAPLFSQANPGNWTTDSTALATQFMRVYTPATTTRVDGRGNPWRYDYDSGGYLTRVQAPDGATTLYTYDPATLKVATATDANNHTTQYSYDSQGNRLSETDPLGHVTQYQYEPVFNNLTQATLANGAVIQYQYDATGNRIQEIQDVGGLNLTRHWTYDARGNVLTETDPNGHSTQYQYGADGNRTQLTDPEGHITRYQYDGVGNRTCMTDGNGHHTVYQYDSLNRLIRETAKIGAQDCAPPDANDIITAEYQYDNNGNRVQMQRQANTSTPRTFQTTTYQYDLRQRQTQQTQDPAGLNLSTQTTYDGNDNRITMTDPRGKVTQYTYDVQNRLTQVDDALHNLTQTQYDPVGNRTCVIDANGHDTFYQYDALNRLTRETRKIGPQSCTTADGDDILTQTFYDSGNAIPAPDCLNPQCAGPIPGSSSPASMIDPETKFTYYKYDPINRGVMVIRKVGDIADSFDGNDWSQTTQYDPASNVLVRRDANGNPATYTYFDDNLVKTAANALGETTSYTYDGAHGVKTATSPGGNVTTSTYDDRNLLVRVDDSVGLVATYSYDGIGNRSQQCDGNGNCTNYAYDAANRMVTTTDALAQSGQYQYDAAGNLLKTLDRDGKAVCYVYDDINRRVRQVQKIGDTDCNAGGGDGDADDVWTKTAYDAVGNVVELTTAKMNAGGTPAICNGGGPTPDCETTTYVYDEINRVVQESYPDHDPDKDSREFAYDQASNLVQRIDQNNRVTDYQYDDLYRLTNRIYDADPDDHFTYDVGGRMLSACREGPTDNVADACPGWLVTFSYDAANRVVSTAQNGQTVGYAYNIPARQRTLTYPGGKVVAEQRDLRERLDTLNAGAIADYSYDLGNRVAARLYGNGTRAAYAYNANNWITDLTHTKSDTSLIAGFGHDYDNEGDKRYEDKAHDPTRSEGYQYDDLHRLITYKVGTLNLSGDVPVPLTQTQYDLDKLGNWDSKTVTPDVGPVVVENRQHNAVNEITQIDAVPVASDADGNLIQDQRYHYAYDQENRLIGVTQIAPPELAGNYQYDALSRRIVKATGPTRGNSETRYFYDDARIVEEQNPAAATLAIYTYGVYIDEALTMERGGQTYYYHQNALWSVAAITDAGEAVVERYSYDAYGAVTMTDGAGVPVPLTAWGAPHSAIGNPWAFTGRQLDEETALYYYRARVYDSGKGRFLQRDPKKYANGLNLYEYAKSSPENLLDPSGAITVTTVKADKLPCGGRDVQWVFSLDGAAPCDGYIVQQVTILEEIKDCVDCPRATKLKPSSEFWEAWYVKKGDKESWDTTRDKYTDGSKKPSRPGTCGYNVALGSIKFFCKTPLKEGDPGTGDLGDLGRDARGKPGGWQTQNPRTQAGGLPSTTTKPAWWDSKPVEGSASRFASSYWCCCPGKEAFNMLGVSPAMKDKPVWQ
jgi:RHS repeat-associated protein